MPIVSVLTKTQQGSAPERICLKRLRLAVVVGGLILLISGILALRKVGSFSRLGDKFGWSALAIGFSLMVGFGSFKYVKKVEPSRDSLPHNTRKSKPSTTRADRTSKPEKSRKPLSPVQIPFRREAQVFKLNVYDLTSVRFSDDRIVVATRHNEGHYAIDGKSVENRDKDESLYPSDGGSYEELFWQVSEKGDRIVLYEPGKEQVLLFIDAKEGQNRQPLTIPCNSKPLSPPIVAMSGDRLVIAIDDTIHIVSCTERKILSAHITEGEISRILIEGDRLSYLYRDQGDHKNRKTGFTVKVVSLVNFAPLQTIRGAQITFLGADICQRIWYNKEKFSYSTSLCSLQTGKDLQDVKEDCTFYKSICYKNIYISYVAKIIETTKADGKIYRTQSPYLRFTSKEGDLLEQEWPLEGEWNYYLDQESVNLKIIGDELVVYSQKLPEYLDENNQYSTLTIRRYPLANSNS